MANNNMHLNYIGIHVSGSRAAGYIIVTGSNCLHIAEALGYPNFLLVRDSPASDDEKPKLIFHGSLEDQASLKDAIKKVDVVMSAVKGPQLIKAIEEIGTIKSYLPFEFGNDVDNTRAMEPEKNMFGAKAKILTAIEAKGIPYTYVSSKCSAEYFLPSLGQPGLTAPPDDQAGNDKVAFLKEDDVTFTIKEVDDPRALNNMLYNLRFPANTYSINKLVAPRGMMISKTLENTYVPEEEEQKITAESAFPTNAMLSTRHSTFVKGDQSNFEIGADDVEASQLYPEVKFASVEESLTQYV